MNRFVQELLDRLLDCVGFELNW